MRKMKDSGIQWIGQIPENWKISKIKNALDIVRGGSPRPIDNYISQNDEGINWIKIGDTTKGSKYIYNTKIKIIESGAIKSRFVHIDDLILTNSMSFGEPYIMKTEGCIHDGWLAFSNYRGIDKEYLYYCLSSPLCKIQFEQSVDGGVVQNLNIDKVKVTFIAIPPLAEQTRIANFLDQKCSAIDSVLEKTRASIEEYKKLKQSVITQAVTKGIRPNRPMKDSGIEWIGQIPEDWLVIQLKHICKVIDPQPDHRAPALSQGEGFPYIGIRDVLPNGELNFATARMIEEEAVIKQEKAFKIDDNDILFGKVGTLGNPVIIKPRGRFAISATLVLIKSGEKCNSIYLRFSLDSTITYNQIGFWNMTSTRPSLGIKQIRNLYVFLPPTKEQQEIADYLDTKCTEIDNLIAKKEQFLKEIETYKKSLIYEYVTGKRRVDN